MWEWHQISESFRRISREIQNIPDGRKWFVELTNTCVTRSPAAKQPNSFSVCRSSPHILACSCYNSWVTSSVLCPGTSPYGPPHHLLPIIFVEIHMDVWCLYVVDVQNIHQKWPPLISVSLVVVWYHSCRVCQKQKDLHQSFLVLWKQRLPTTRKILFSYLKKQQ